MIPFIIVSKKSKREVRNRENTRNVALEDFEALIKEYGYIKESGKHPKARIGSATMPYKRENPVKPTYVKELLSIIDGL
jgi:adenylosuccinate lyase